MISGGLNKVLQNDVSPVVICSAVLIWLIAFPPCLPAQPLQIDATRQLDLADHFYDIQAYRDAVTEYRKFRFFFPDHDRAAYARFRIAMAFFKQKDYETAVVYFERIAGATYAGEYSIEACFMASRCYTAMGSSARAVANLKALLEVTSDPAITDRAWHEIGWINLDTARPLTESAYENARLAFFNISHPGREQYGIADLLVHLDWAQYDPDGLTATMKSPGLAGGLAVIPGAGYLYTNRYQDALVAFL